MLIKTFLSNNLTRRLDRAKFVDEPSLMISRDINCYGYVLKNKAEIIPILVMSIYRLIIRIKKYIET